MIPWLPFSLAASAITAATPLVFASLGELVVERSGVLNLGLEGMMLTGAVAAFAIKSQTGSGALAVIAAGLAGAALAGLFGILVLHLRGNQVAAGLALTIFGSGLSGLLGTGFTGRPIPALPKLEIPGLSALPGLGPIVFHQDALVYASLLSAAAIAWFLKHTRAGLVLRAVGDADHSAHALGYPVIGIRYGAILFGGAMSGIGGAYLSLAYTPFWAENMTAGRGWIALAIVVFSAWRPWPAFAGAYLFGALTVLQLYWQASGWLTIPAQLLATLPYLTTLAVLVIVSARSQRGRSRAPASLGRTFSPPR